MAEQRTLDAPGVRFRYAVARSLGDFLDAVEPPAIIPSVEDSPTFRAVVAASIVPTAAGWVAVALNALPRWCTSRMADGGSIRRGH